MTKAKFTAIVYITGSFNNSAEEEGKVRDYLKKFIVFMMMLCLGVSVQASAQEGYNPKTEIEALKAKVTILNSQMEVVQNTLNEMNNGKAVSKKQIRKLKRDYAKFQNDYKNVNQRLAVLEKNNQSTAVTKKESGAEPQTTEKKQAKNTASGSVVNFTYQSTSFVGESDSLADYNKIGFMAGFSEGISVNGIDLWYSTKNGKLLMTVNEQIVYHGVPGPVSYSIGGSDTWVKVGDIFVLKTSDDGKLLKRKYY